MSFPYKHVLLIGATAGIGKAMAEGFLKSGIKVTVVGRRTERLEEFVRRYGPDKAKPISFDISNVDQIPKFAEKTMHDSPDIDCIFLNAGVQRPHDLAKSDGFDLDLFNLEIHVNLTSFVALSQAFLPYLMNKGSPSSIVYTGSNIAIVPAAPLPAYSASKAGLNAFILCLREQLRNSNVKIIEISPPPVQTELHDYMGEDRGRIFGMPLEEFSNKAFDGLFSGSDQIVIGSIGPEDTFNEIVDKRRTAFQNLAKMMRGEK